jgi:fructose/tagatose bisphosphate aldolase
VRQFLDQDAKVVDPRKYLDRSRTEMAVTVSHLLRTVSG